jgi:hypothetical protein
LRRVPRSGRGRGTPDSTVSSPVLEASVGERRGVRNVARPSGRQRSRPGSPGWITQVVQRLPPPHPPPSARARASLLSDNASIRAAPASASPPASLLVPPAHQTFPVRCVELVSRSSTRAPSSVAFGPIVDSVGLDTTESALGRARISASAPHTLALDLPSVGEGPGGPSSKPATW